MSDQFMVQRVGIFPVTNEMREREGLPESVHEYHEATVPTFGPFDREGAKRKAIEIHETTGDEVNVIRQCDNQTVASIWPSGDRIIPEQHDDEGNRLPRSEWSDFWQE